MGGIIGKKEILGMDEVRSWFPSVLGVRIAEPFDEIFMATAVESFIEDGFNFILIVTSDLDRRWSSSMGTIG